jgi:DNA-binding response OmpR family regulator
MRILIVEDEKSLADVIKKGLKEEGYAVDEKASRLYRRVIVLHQSENG